MERNVTMAEISDGKIHLGKAAYSVVILPPCHCMESYARNKLEEFTAQGGTVIGIEEIPTYAIDGGENNEETKERWKLLFEKPSAFFFTEMKDAYFLKFSGSLSEYNTVRFGSGDGPMFSNVWRKRKSVLVTIERPSCPRPATSKVAHTGSPENNSL